MGPVVRIHGLQAWKAPPRAHRAGVLIAANATESSVRVNLYSQVPSRLDGTGIPSCFSIFPDRFLCVFSLL